MDGENATAASTTAPSLYRDRLASTSSSAATPPHDPHQLEKAPETVEPIPHFPDGGLTAWLQVFASFFVFFNTWGIVNAFGSFQTYYESNLLTSSGSSAISWVGSIQSFLLLIVGVISGPLYDKGYLHHLNVVGTICVVVGLVLLSVCKKYYQVLLTQGILMGLGTGLLFLQSVAILQPYFKRRRAFATGIAACGSSVGGIIFPTIFREMLGKVGFGWTVRTMALIVLVTQLTAISLMRQRSLPAKSRRMINLTVLKDPAFALFCLAGAITFMGLYVPFFYVPSRALSQGIMSERLAYYLIPVLNAGSIFGRLIPNFWADRLGYFNMFIPCCVFAAILGFAWISVESAATTIIFCLFYGAFSGTYVSVQGPAVAMITKEPDELGGRLAIAFSFNSIGILIGTPVAGALINVEKGEYLHAQIYCGVLVAVGSCLLIAVRTTVLRGFKPLTKI